MKDLFPSRRTSEQMMEYGFSLNVNGNWIDLEYSSGWNWIVTIKYNDEPVLTEKIRGTSGRGEFEFDAVEENTEVRYYIEMVLLGERWEFYVTRNGIPILATSRNRREVTKRKTVPTRVICYEIRGKDDFVEIPLGAANISTSGVYCFVDYDRKAIYLWYGRDSGFLRRYAGDGASFILRKRFGQDFRIETIKEGDEPSVFENLFREYYHE